MIKRLTFGDFIKEFEFYNREDHYSIYGLKALFDYYEELEKTTNEPVELDVLTISCDWVEYDNVNDFLKKYGYESLEEAKEDEDEGIHNIIYLANGSILVHFQ